MAVAAYDAKLIVHLVLLYEYYCKKLNSLKHLVLSST